MTRRVASEPVRLMVWNAARGGMRAVVEGYRDDGFLARENVTLVASYEDGGFARRQLVLFGGPTRFARLLATRRVDLVHLHAAMRGSFWRKGLFASLARRAGIPVLLHLHGSEMRTFYDTQHPAVKAMIRARLEKATRVLVLSGSWKRFIDGIAPAARTVVVPNYVTVPPPADPGGRDGREILFLGLVGDRKGVFDLLPAFAEVHRAVPEARLVIGGNGEVERAREEVTRLGIGDAVTLAGWVGGEAKAAMLARASIYVLPSHNEGLPMSVLEAMAAGLPVVTTRVGGIPELVTDGVDGLLVDAGNKTALAAALTRLLRDPEERARIGAAARRRIEQDYSDTAILPRLADLYAETTGRAPTPPVAA